METKINDTQPSATPVADTPQISTQPSPKPQRSNILILMIIVFTLLALSGYFLYRLITTNALSTLIPDKEMVIEKTTISMPKQDEQDRNGIATESSEMISGTYRNRTAGFEVTLPENWRVVQLENAVGFGPVAIGEDIIWTIAYHRSGTLTAEKIAESMGSQFRDRAVTTETIMIDEMPATKLTATTPELEQWTHINIIIQTNGWDYVIGNGSLSDESLLEQYGDGKTVLFEQFYSTFHIDNQ